MSLRSELDALATALCKKAQLEATPIEASTDALKAVAAYYAIREKVKLKSGDDDGDSAPMNFKDFEGAIRSAGTQEGNNGRSTSAAASRRRDS